jgi:hypothetical protein
MDSIIKCEMTENTNEIIEQIEPVKRKKGRPRKQIIEEVNDVKPEKKKRGRKKKEVKEQEIKPKKKRGRKAAIKFFSSSIRKKIPLTTVIQDNNNYILHLDIKEENDNENEIKLNNQESELDELIEQLNIEDNEINIDDLHNINNLEDMEIETTDDLSELYEQRITNREKQDKLLVEKLEMLHEDEKFIDRLMESSIKTKENNTKTVETEELKQDTNRKKGYFELLYKFIHNETWLDKTDVNCWWCCHQFDSLPIGAPVSYADNVKKFRVKGVFCSFACMVAYSKDNHMCNQQLITYLYKQLTGEIIDIKSLKPAPMRCVLKMFGGELDIKEFRSTNESNILYKMIEYPMFMSRDYVEEVDIKNLKNINMDIFDETSYQQNIISLDEKRVHDAKQRLMMQQIEKTTVTLGNTIDKFIKIN